MSEEGFLSASSLYPKTKPRSASEEREEEVVVVVVVVVVLLLLNLLHNLT